jgi:hypothetical protein
MSEGGEGYKPEVQEQREQPPVRLPVESVRSHEVEENLVPYVSAHFAYRDYWAEDGTPQERAAKEASEGAATSPEAEVYSELIGTAFSEVAQANEHGQEFQDAFKDLDAARTAFLLLAVSKARFTQRDLYVNLGDIRTAPANVDLTARQARLVQYLADRASLPYDASQTSIKTDLDFSPAARAGRSGPASSAGQA